MQMTSRLRNSHTRHDFFLKKNTKIFISVAIIISEYEIVHSLFLKIIPKGESYMNIKFTTKVFGAVAAALLLSTSANAAKCGK